MNFEEKLNALENILKSIKEGKVVELNESTYTMYSNYLKEVNRNEDLSLLEENKNKS